VNDSNPPKERVERQRRRPCQFRGNENGGREKNESELKGKSRRRWNRRSTLKLLREEVLEA
jgi:hypothetical protein